MLPSLYFWLSLVVILGCLLLCLQPRKDVVPFRYEGIKPWAAAVPLVSALGTLAARGESPLIVSQVRAIKCAHGNGEEKAAASKGFMGGH